MATGLPSCEMDEQFFAEIVQYIPPKNWKMFARKLGMKDRDVDAIQMDNCHNGTDEQIYQMLKVWRDRTHGASVDKLLNTFQGMRLHSEAQQVKVLVLGGSLDTELVEDQLEIQSIRTVGCEGRKLGAFSEPCGITTNHKEELVVADRDNHRIQIMTWNGRQQKQIFFNHFLNPFTPWDVAVSSDGIYYVSDTGNHQIVVCRENNVLISTFGNNENIDPGSIALTIDQHHLMVADFQASLYCVRKYTVEGEHIAVYGTSFSYPYALCGTSDDNVIVSDSANDVIHVLNSECQSVNSFPHGVSEVRFPTGVDVDETGNVLVCDSVNNRILKYDNQGHLLASIGQDQVQSPKYIVVSKNGPLRIAITEEMKHTVKVLYL